MPTRPLRATLRDRSVRRAATVWALVVALVGSAVGVVWAAGGFSSDATPFLGTRVAPGEFVSTRFWDVAVHAAEVSHVYGEITVAITVVNKQDETAVELTDYMLAVRLPEGRAMLQTFCVSQRGNRFAPLIPADALCTFGYEVNQVPPASIPGPGPVDIEVVVLDQGLSDGLLEGARPEISEPAAWVPLLANVAPEEA